MKSGETLDLSKAEELAIECDAEEVEEVDDGEGSTAFEFYAHPEGYFAVSRRLADSGCNVLASEALYLPRNEIKLNANARGLVKNLEEKLLEIPIVMAVHTNAAS